MNPDDTDFEIRLGLSENNFPQFLVLLDGDTKQHIQVQDLNFVTSISTEKPSYKKVKKKQKPYSIRLVCQNSLLNQPNMLFSSELQTKIQDTLVFMAKSCIDYRQSLQTISTTEINDLIQGVRNIITRKHARVVDLIDPSLNCHFPSVQNIQVQHMVNRPKKNNVSSSPIAVSNKSDTKTEAGNQAHWIPADISVNTQYNVKFISEINNLDYRKYPDFPDICSEILSKLIKQWEYIVKDKLNNRILQVIVKSQYYEVYPDGFYIGQLHKEGTSQEDIVASGIYYSAIDEKLQGGELEIAFSKKGSMGQSCMQKQTICVRQGQLLSFDNTKTHHRMLKLHYPQNTLDERKKTKDQTDNKNTNNNDYSLSDSSDETEYSFREQETEESVQINPFTLTLPPAKRWIIAFFLINPHKTMVSSSQILVNSQFKISDLLRDYFTETQPDMPTVIMDICCDYIITIDPLDADRLKFKTSRDLLSRQNLLDSRRQKYLD